MKKYFARILSLTLCVLIIFATVACSKEEQVSDDTQNQAISTEEAEIKPVFSGNTYDGENFTILIRADTAEGTYLSDLGVELNASSSVIDRAVYNRNVTIEEQFDVKFDFITVNNSTKYTQYITAATMSDADTYDMVSSDGRTIFKGVLNGFYMDWNQLDYVNLDAPWWSQNAREEWTTLSNRLYCMNGDLSYMSVGSAGVMYFNRDVFSKAKLTTPYEFVENDTWTLETFTKSVKDADASMVGDGSGSPETDTFGYGTEAWRGPIQAVFSAGVSTLVKGGDGKYTIGVKSNRVSDAMAAYDSLINSSETYYAGIGVGPARQYFINGAYAYFDDIIKCAVTFNNSGLNFGIVPWPKYDTDTENYKSLVGSGTNTFAVLKNTSDDNRVKISDILEALAYYGYKDVISAYFDTVISYQAVQDEHSYEMLQLVRQTLHFDIGHYGNFGKIGDIGKNVIEKKDGYQSISTAITAIEGNVMLDLDLWYALDD